jgi:sarcosine oxidase subunit delta
MLLIPCPWCGPRAEAEFNCGGEGGLARPANTEALSDEQWGDYVFMRMNPKGVHHEQWRHTSGCGRWFNALRDTVSYRIHAVWKIGEEPPAQAAAHATSRSAA